MISTDESSDRPNNTISHSYLLDNSSDTNDYNHTMTSTTPLPSVNSSPMIKSTASISSFISHLRKRLPSADSSGCVTQLSSGHSGTDNDNSSGTDSGALTIQPSGCTDKGAKEIEIIVELKNGRRKSLSLIDSESMRLARSQNSCLEARQLDPQDSRLNEGKYYLEILIIQLSL
jgi:hypothetical protein